MTKYSEIRIPGNRKCCLYNESFKRSEDGVIYEFDSVGYKLWHFSTDKFNEIIKLPLVENCILMCFFINNSGNLEYGVSERLSFKTEEHNLIYLPHSEYASVSIPKNEKLEVFVVMLQAEVFFNYFPVNSSELFINFKQQVQKKKDAVLLSSINFPINLDMKGVINSMITSHRNDECKHIYFKAKIIELLSLQLEQFMTVDIIINKGRNLKKDEFDRVNEVKRILEENPEKSYTLLGLARCVGTNDATLKKHFKMAFGTTVFSYLNRCRMEKAHLMLQEHDHKISIVAEEVGFKYATHFSAAFKKHFGYSPAELKNADKNIEIPV
ncbi:MAG TPA: AraC family transcriptional regulator [Sphingobacteriaceae bacterium]|nr:AraC family transcriptional regulator [Sphingobacteriaceae bacterium]